MVINRPTSCITRPMLFCILATPTEADLGSDEEKLVQRRRAGWGGGARPRTYTSSRALRRDGDDHRSPRVPPRALPLPSARLPGTHCPRRQTGSPARLQRTAAGQRRRAFRAPRQKALIAGVHVQAGVQRSGKMLPCPTTCCFCSATHRSLICNLLSIYAYYGCTLRNY
jgi:hypothetical protein